MCRWHGPPHAHRLFTVCGCDGTVQRLGYRGHRPRSDVGQVPHILKERITSEKGFLKGQLHERVGEQRLEPFARFEGLFNDFA
jgi:hypothetical protein